MYVTEVLNAPKPVQFANPSVAEEWDNPDKEQFVILFVLESHKKLAKLPAVLSDISVLRAIRQNLNHVELQPAGC
jgi:hypothetical protein